MKTLNLKNVCSCILHFKTHVTRQIYNLFQDLWNRFILRGGGGFKVSLVPRLCRLIDRMGGTSTTHFWEFWMHYVGFSRLCGSILNAFGGIKAKKFLAKNFGEDFRGGGGWGTKTCFKTPVPQVTMHQVAGIQKYPGHEWSTKILNLSQLPEFWHPVVQFGVGLLDCELPVTDCQHEVPDFRFSSENSWQGNFDEQIKWCEFF